MAAMLNFFVMFGLCLFPSISWGMDANDMLAKAERFRLPYTQARLEITLEHYQNQVINQTRRYRVYVQKNRRALLLFQNTGERGQKVLMVGKKHWLLSPKMRRPIRIKATHQVLEHISITELAMLPWEGVYAPSLINPAGTYQKKNAIKLKLKGNETAAYTQIVLWLSPETYAPMAADFYQADELLKHADFYLDTAQKQINNIDWQDKTNTQQHTQMQIQSVTPVVLADKYFKPMFLIRNGIPE